MKKSGLFILFSVLFTLFVCVLFLGKMKTNITVDANIRQEEVCINDYISDSANGSIIYNSFIKCQDYKQLKQLGFSPCWEMENKIEKIQENITIKKIRDISFENCNIMGNNKDIIMTASVETDLFNFEMMLLFLDSKNKAAFDIIAQEKKLNYQLADINCDGKLEIIVDYLGLNKSRKYIGIYQYKKEIVPIFEENVDSFQYDISYRFSNLEFTLNKVKYYYNESNEKKKAKIVEFVYRFDNNSMVLLNKKTLWESNLEDFHAWTLG